MKHLTALTLGLTLLAAPLLAEGHATGDAANGEKVFSKCKSCHMIASAEETIFKGGNVGPNLYGVYTRVAGTQADYTKYGDSLVATGAAGLAWNEDDFVSYVADPKGFLTEYLDDRKARSNMSFKLKDEDDAKDVWAYLVSVGPEVEAAPAAASN
jgi:cytochrome c